MCYLLAGASFYLVVLLSFFRVQVALGLENGQDGTRDAEDSDLCSTEMSEDEFQVDSVPTDGERFVLCTVWPLASLKTNQIACNSNTRMMLSFPKNGRILVVKDKPENAVECSKDVHPLLTIEFREPRHGKESPVDMERAKPNNTPKNGKGRRKSMVMSPSMRQGVELSGPATMPEQKKTEGNSSRSYEEAATDLREALLGSSSNRARTVLKALLVARCGHIFLFPGNALIVTFMGVEVICRVNIAEETHPNSFFSLNECLGFDIKFQEEKEDSKGRSNVDYSIAAREIATNEMGLGEEGPVANAIQRSAWLGQLSLKSTSKFRVGGLEKQKLLLQQWISFPLKNFSFFEEQGIMPPVGVLLHGPPGTGKTLLAKSLSQDSGAKLFVLNGSDIMTEFMGESEKCLKGIFQVAKALCPAVRSNVSKIYNCVLCNAG